MTSKTTRKVIIALYCSFNDKLSLRKKNLIDQYYYPSHFHALEKKKKFFFKKSQSYFHFLLSIQYVTVSLYVISIVFTFIAHIVFIVKFVAVY
jgi:hypothetical protein